jgi:ABC-type nitrate/sulfonate/bicarbonate transport system substrate-binding protein
MPMTPPSPEPLTVSVFPGGFNWPLFVGCDTGLFAAEGLAVRIVPTAGSVAQMSDFAAGRFEIAMTAFDNIVAYVAGEGEAPIGPQPQFFAFLGSDDSFLRLVAAGDVADAAGLRGRAVSVDAATTGYAFVLYEMLARAGLAGGDYRVERVGGMVQRWDDLRAGGHAATLLSGPYDLLAEAAGFRVLGHASRVIGPYQGNVAAARRDWAAAHPAQVTGFIRAYAGAVRWLQDAANRAEAVAILRRHVPGMTEALAEASADVLPQGFFGDVGINLAGAATVLALRRRYLPGSRAAVDAADYIDLRYWRAAGCSAGGRQP